MIYEFIKKTKLNQNLDRRLVLMSDMVMASIASMCSILFVGVVAKNLYSIEYVLVWICSSIILALGSFSVMKTHHSVLRNSSFYEIWRLLLATLIKEILLGCTVILLHRNFDYSVPHLLALILVDLLTTMMLLTLDRIVVVSVYDIMRQKAQRMRKAATVLVYGNHTDSQSFASIYYERYNIAGYLVRGNDKHKEHIGDTIVYTFDSEARLGRIIDMNNINAIVFTKQDDVNAEEEKLIRYCQNNNVRTLFMPQITEVSTAVTAKTRSKAREIRIEDLLGRSVIQLSSDEVKENFRNKVIMVTGAAGSIGSELCRQLATFGIKHLVCYDNAETPSHNIRLELEESFPELSFTPVIGDIRNNKRLEETFEKFHPQIVFHAGAYKHVPLMEENPCEAVIANVVGSRNVADACVKYNVEKMIMISTDKAVNPTNIMGCTKRLAEIYVQSLALAIEQGKVKGNTKFVTTRFGNVLGSNGSVIPRFTDQIAKGGPVTVTHPEITRFFMTIPEACRLVMEAATHGEENKIFVFDMGKSVKIADMARRMIELAGFVPDKDIKIEYTGLRPGEKLYEEVLSNEENTIPTEHKSIRIAKVRQYEYKEVHQTLEQLEKLALNLDVNKMVYTMKHIVPEFKSKNSVFEKIDTIIDDEIIKNK